MKNTALIIFLLAMATACNQKPESSPTKKPMTTKTNFVAQRGVNISHWLSQSKRRGEERKVYFTEADVKAIADAGFDHFRLPIDEEQMWDESGSKEPVAFALLHEALSWAKKYNLNTLVDLHIVRAHHFLDESPALFIDPKEQEKFGDLWKQLSQELINYPVEEVAYELLNESVATDHEDWNKVYRIAYDVVRQNEPNRVIYLGPNRWQKAENFKYLKVPNEDPNIVLSYHFYTPMPITHYAASWTNMKDYTGPVKYPGISISPQDTLQLDEAVAASVRDYVGKHYDREEFIKLMQPAFDAADKYGLSLYCGEFGAFHKTPEDIRMRWYSDVISILEEHDIAWAAWDLKGSFAVFNEGDRSLAIPKEILFQQ